MVQHTYCFDQGKFIGFVFLFFFVFFYKFKVKAILYPQKQHFVVFYDFDIWVAVKSAEKFEFGGGVVPILLD